MPEVGVGKRNSRQMFNEGKCEIVIVNNYLSIRTFLIEKKISFFPHCVGVLLKNQK